jgi:guanylate kinase
LLARLLSKNKSFKKIFAKSVSLTTRPKRPGEREGRDYFFISPTEFLRLRRQKKILEWTRYLSYDYGTPRDFVEGQLKKGKCLLLCLDTKGALNIKRLYPKSSVTIFVLAPSLKELKKRIHRRSRETKREILKRLKLARKELTASKRYDYCIVNRDLPKTVAELRNIILGEIRR